jgi:hypothetical protein
MVAKERGSAPPALRKAVAIESPDGSTFRTGIGAHSTNYEKTFQRKDRRQRERAKKGGNIGHKRKARGTRQVQKGIRKTSQQISGHSSESGKQAGKRKLGGREGGGGMSGSTVLGRLEDDRHSATQTRVGDKRCLGPNHRNDRRTDGAKLQTRERKYNA